MAVHHSSQFSQGRIEYVGGGGGVGDSCGSGHPLPLWRTPNFRKRENSCVCGRMQRVLVKSFLLLLFFLCFFRKFTLG